MPAAPLRWLPATVGWSKRKPQLVIETRTFWDAAITSVIAHLIQGKPIRYCERPDCGNPFPAHNNREIFCSWKCAHVVSSRNARKPKIDNVRFKKHQKEGKGA
jgi:hypothetical protein